MNVHGLLSRLRPPFERRMPALTGGTTWLNSDPLAPDDLAGKVVAVDFWTYTCINWIRTLPYVRAWEEAYREHGLVVVGVHTPEFGVEHDVDNVRRAVRAMGITYPVVVDNQYAIWNAFANHYWPALYLADQEGNIRHHHFGEGSESDIEQVIRRLLVDTTDAELPEPAMPAVVNGIEAPADWDSLQSPETYLGLARGSGFASREPAALGEPRAYTVPPQLGVNEWALGGSWSIGHEDAVADEPNGRIAYRFHARDVHLILAPPAHGAAGIRVRLDGHPPGDAHGVDVDAEGNGVVDEPRLYQLIRQPGPIMDRQVEIELLEPGAAALCFTFG